MQIIKKSQRGIDYLIGILKDKANVFLKVVFWKIPREHHEPTISLKIGRYRKIKLVAKGKQVGLSETPENNKPKSELTLDNEELDALLEFLEINYEPFKKGVRKYIPLDEKFDEKSIDHLKAIFDNPDKTKVLEFVAHNNILPEELLYSLRGLQRRRAVEELEKMIGAESTEYNWQKWFEKNDWVLGSEFVKVLDERAIDAKNISDFLMQAYDGFLDIIEIKRPSRELRFWAAAQDHDNYVPSSCLVKAITQAAKYIYEIEREANSAKFFERVGNVKTIKPRCVLIFGRSNDWNDGQKEAYRILNASYHNLTILTYDYVLNRAKRILGLEEKNQINASPNP